LGLHSYIGESSKSKRSRTDKTRSFINDIKNIFVTSLKELMRYKQPTTKSLTNNNKNDTNSTVNINKLYSRMLEMKLSNEDLAKFRKKTV
jgi:hypothetical protein